MKPPPPTGLVNRSGSSESSISSSSSSSSSFVPRPRGTWPGLCLVLVCWPLARSQPTPSLRGSRRIPAAGSSIAARPAAMLSEAAGESLRPAMSRSPIEARTPGSSSRWRPVRGDPRSPDSVWPAADGGPAAARRRGPGCRPRSSMRARRSPRVSRGAAPTVDEIVWPSVHEGSPGCNSATATGRPASAEANMPSACNRSPRASSATADLRTRHLVDQISVPT